MTPFEKAIEFVLAEEGGFSDDPNDDGNWTGGEKGKGELRGTNFGISAKSYPTLNIRGITRDDAIAIYKRDFWDRCKCGQLPSPIALMVFDCAVNQGAGTAAHLLQQAVGVKQDGIIGMITISAARKADIKTTLSKLMAGRCVRYSIAKNVHLYGKTWFRRATSCLITAIELL